ncbi:helix-turn-helix domain-containing protein [Desulfosporosinus sp. OT]|uniref:winged helix-turn-helix transcriptional regulator n=1 Tax=Desulfosporosinus sp. OT TaxID=913865 RepID=UPI0002239CF5|nr:helix-turn-helix domain-containing protein [Desulfosporosinus sp. OT]EGW38677.1 hxlR-like helix-turn-helix family protein [Desulfosporosinus sp. OT]
MEKTDSLFGKCPYFTAQKVFSGKWSILIMYHLNHGALRFGELQRRLDTITQATLTKQLRMLEYFGLVSRYVYSEIPPKVEYSLTDLGKAFNPVLEQFKIWGDKYVQSLKNEQLITPKEIRDLSND